MNRARESSRETLERERESRERVCVERAERDNKEIWRESRVREDIGYNFYY